MSRSYRKTPKHGVADTSEKRDKKRWHKKFRRKEHLALISGLEPPTDPNEVVNVWDMAKDGKRKLDLDYPEERKLMRK